MYLEETLKPVNFGNSVVEYKRILDRSNTVDWLKTVAGFANAKGGTLIIGVEDPSHKLTGFDRQSCDEERNYFNNQVNEHITPRPPINISFLCYKNRDKELFVIRIDIKESSYKPVIMKFKGVPSIYMRRAGFTNGATTEEIIDMSIKSQNSQFDVLYSDRQYSRDDFTMLFHYYAEHNDGKQLTDKALKSIGFFNSDNQLANGAVLFMDHYPGTKTAVMCSVFSGKNKGSERIITVNRYHTNLLDSIMNACEFVEQRMNHSIIKMNDGRENIDAYPQRALFEGIINAIAHRDYFLGGTQIQIDMFQDRLEISSPGSFYKGAEISKTYDLSSIISKRRNELICAVLVKCNVMEAAGTGFDKIIEEYKDVDIRHKPFIYSSSDHFTLVLPDLTYDDGVSVNILLPLVFAPIPNKTEHDRAVLSFCYDACHSTKEIAEYLGISNSTYLRKQVLENLVREKQLIIVGKSRPILFRTNTEMVSLLPQDSL